MKVPENDDSEQAGKTIYVVAAWTGAAFFFILPVSVLLLGCNPLTAAMLGYVSIAIFTGGISARYDVVTSEKPVVQLFANMMLSTGVALVFFLIFLLLYHL